MKNRNHYQGKNMLGKKLFRKAGSAVMALAIFAGGATALLAQQQTETASITVNAAASKIWNGKADTSWYSSSKSTFYISTPEQLAGLAKLVSNGNTMRKKCFVLTADLVMNDTSNFANWGKNPPKNNWVPIGAKPNGKSTADLWKGIKATEFEGSFNGNGHTITGLYCNHEMYGGLFAILNFGSVIRTVMKNCYICANEPIQTESSVRNWKFGNLERKNYFKYPNFVPTAGGIAAVSQSGCISECEFGGKVLALGHDDYSTISNGRQSEGIDACAGGIVGRYSTSSDLVLPFVMAVSPIGVGTAFQPLEYLAWLNSETSGCGIYNCINKGSVHAQYSKWKNTKGTEFLTDKAYAGGIAGACSVSLDGKNAEIKRCVNFGKLTTTHEPAAGIVGISSGIILTDNYYSYANQACTAKIAGSAGTCTERIKSYDTKGHAVRCGDTVHNKKVIANQFSKQFNFYGNDIRLNCDVVCHNGAITLNHTSMSLGKNETVKLTASVIDSTITNKTVKWRSSSSKILTVDQNGNVKAISTGTAWITAKASNGAEKSCKITVKNAPASVYLNKQTLTMKVGQTAKLSASLNSGAACATRTFRSSNSSIVKMTKTNWEGEFKAMKKGTAWVTVRTYNGKEASCKITVV